MKSKAILAACALVVLAATAAVAEQVGPLNVPYLSQFWKATKTLPESLRNGNCAPAAVEMAAAYAQGRQAKIENIIELNKLMGKKDPIKGGPTKHREVRDAGIKLYKFPIEYKHMPLGDVLKEVAAGGPVVVGIIYRHLTTRWDQHCTGGHMLVVVGGNEKTIITNDPDDKRPGKGKNMYYDRAEFQKAYADFGNACLIGFRKQPPPASAPAPVEGPG